MRTSILFAFSAIALMAPFLTISVLLACFFRRRAVRKGLTQPRKSRTGFRPSSWALRTALQVLSQFYDPSVKFAVTARQVENVEEDDEGDPESPEEHLDHQLKRIRRGEPVELILRL